MADLSLKFPAPLFTCHDNYRTNSPGFPLSQSPQKPYADLYEKYNALSPSQKVAKPEGFNPIRKQEQQRFPRTMLTQQDLLDSGNRIIINPDDFNSEHPLAQLHSQIAKELGIERFSYQTAIDYGSNYWHQEELGHQSKYEIGEAIGGGAAGTLAGSITTSFLIGSGASALTITVMSGGVALVVGAGGAYLVKLGIEAADDSSVTISPYVIDQEASSLEDIDTQNVNLYGISINVLDDFFFEQNKAQSSLIVLDEAGLLRQIDSDIQRGESCLFGDLNPLKNDLRDLALIGEKAKDNAWAQLSRTVQNFNQNKFQTTQYVNILSDDSKTGQVVTRQAPIIPSKMNGFLPNFKIIVTDLDGNEASSAPLPLDVFGPNGEVNPLYQILVANKLKQSMMTIDDPRQLNSLTEFVSRHLLSLRDRSMIPAEEGIDIGDPSRQNYARLHDAIRLIYSDALVVMREKAHKNGSSQMQRHLQVLSNSLEVARVYSERINLPVYQEINRELKFEKLRRTINLTGYENPDNIFDQNTFNKFQKWAQANKQAFLEFLSKIPEEKLAEGEKFDFADDSNLLRIFNNLSEPIQARQKEKDRLTINLIAWLNQNKNKESENLISSMRFLKDWSLADLSDENLDYLLDQISKKRNSSIQDLLQEMNERLSQNKLLISKENMSKTIGEALFDLGYIDMEERNDFVYDPEKLKEIIARDTKRMQNHQSTIFSQWLQKNQKGELQNLDKDKLAKTLRAYLDLIKEDKSLGETDRNNMLNIVINLMNFAGEDFSNLMIFETENPKSSIDDFYKWIAKHGSINIDKKNPAQKIKADILKTFEYIEKNARINPFNKGIFKIISKEKPYSLAA